MAHPQNSPRGLTSHKRLDIGDVQITANGTVKGLTLNGTAALPGNVDGGVTFTLVTNSTGVALGVNTTGTTWKYLNVTSVQPT